VSIELGSRTWPEVDRAPRPQWLLVPLGSCEQHGPHLPLDTDTRIAVAVADAAAARHDGALVAPPLAYGSSGEHAGFAGTLSIGQDALETVLVELVRSCDAFAGVVLVNGHGGNAAAVARAVTRLRAESRRVVAWWPALAGDAHAGRTETSLLLAVAPEVVRMDLATPGSVEPLSALLPRLRRDGVRAVSPNGVLGNPTGATAREGHQTLDALVDDLVGVLVALSSDGPRDNQVS